MNPRIASMENLIARDPGGRNVFGLAIADQLRLAAQSLRLARRAAIVSGFFVTGAGAGETDGPPGAHALAEALRALGIPVDLVTDARNAPLFHALGEEPRVLDGSPAEVAAACAHYLDERRPTHLVAVERLGRGADGRYRNMRGADVSETTAPLDELFLEGGRRGLTTLGIGDGGNEVGMGRVFTAARTAVCHGRLVATVVPTDYCIVAGVSNWGALGLVGALSVLEGRDLLPAGGKLTADLEKVVEVGGAVDGVTGRREPTVDGLPAAESLRVLEELRSHVAPPPFERGGPLTVGVLGLGETGRAAAALLRSRGHRVRASDAAAHVPEIGLPADDLEAGGHTIGFLEPCDLVVVSPGVPTGAAIRGALHARGIPVMSALEMASALCTNPIVAVTGTVGKRTTAERIGALFRQGGRAVAVGGNRGTPLATLVLAADRGSPGGEPPTFVLAVSSFQLESVVRFRPRVAVMLNLAEAHLDRHRTLAEYVRIKSRIFMNHRPDDALILNADDPRLRPLARKHAGRTFFVSARGPVEQGAWLRRGRVRLAVDGEEEDLGRFEEPFPENLLGALLAARLSGLPAEVLRGGAG
ncbi:MAG: glutamate cyclase domain-containing protein [Thermodesulfobacteriota bacterium]